MKKNIYLTILVIITVFCIICGSVYHIVGWGVSLFDNIFTDSSNKESAGPTITSDGTALEDFTSVSVDVNVMSLTIEPGDTASISYRCSSKLKPDYYVEDDTLYITQKGKRIKFWGSTKCSVTLTLPDDQYYKLLDITAEVGDINIKDLNGENILLNASVGDINIENCEFEDIDIQASVGDVDIEKCSFLLLDIDNSVGDIDVSSRTDLSDYYISMSTSIGEVEVNDHYFRRSYSQDGISKQKSVTLSNSTGDIELSY